jgi:MoxR-like ATPase
MGTYIANQVCYEGLDEIQRLILTYKLGCHTAIDGPPGVGKTRVIQEVAKILKKIYILKTVPLALLNLILFHFLC